MSWVNICHECNRIERDRCHGCTRGAATELPDPKPGKQVVLDQVLQDLRDRAEKGKKKYGTFLETFNGRSALMDAYQEALDLVMYLRQLLMEEESVR